MMFAYMIEEKDSHILRRKYGPYLEKINDYCRKSKIDVDFSGQNVTFFKEGKRLAISYVYLWRQSGLCRVHREKGEHLIELVDVTDEMFYENYVKPIINLYFPK